MSEQPIPLETYRILLEDEFELEEIIAMSKQTPGQRLLLEYARILCDLGNQHAQILCALGEQLKQVSQLLTEETD